MEKEILGRRTSIKKIVAFLLIAPGLQSFLQACGSSGSSPAQPTSAGTPGPGASPQAPGTAAASACVTNGTATTVEGDPLHQLTVPREDVAAGTPKDYHIQGQENHDHIVTLTSADFATLQGGQGIRKASGVSIGPVAPHFHFVDVACAA